MTIHGAVVFPFIGLRDELSIVPKQSKWGQWRYVNTEGPQQAGETVEVTLVATKVYPRIKMLLKDESGTPLASQAIGVQFYSRSVKEWSSNGSTDQWKSFFSRADGSFEIPINRGRSGQKIFVRLGRPGGDGSPFLFTSIEIPLPLPIPWDPPEKKFDIELGNQVMFARTLVASGRIHDGADEGLHAQFEIEHLVVEHYGEILDTNYLDLPGAITEIDEDGYFQCYGVTQSEQVHLTILPEGYFAQKQILNTGVTDLDFTLKPDLAVYGQLIIPQGYALQDFNLRFFENEETPSHFSYVGEKETQPNADGSFRIGNIEDRAPGTVGVIYVPSESVVASFTKVTPVSNSDDVDSRLNPINLEGLMTAQIQVKTWDKRWLGGRIHVTLLDAPDESEPKERYQWNDQFLLSAVAPSLRIQVENDDHRTQEFTVVHGPNILQLEKAWNVTLNVKSLPALPDGLQYVIRLDEKEEDRMFDFVDHFPPGFRGGKYSFPIKDPGNHLVRLGVETTDRWRSAWHPNWRFPFTFLGTSKGASVDVSLTPEIAAILIQRVQEPPAPHHNH